MEIKIKPPNFLSDLSTSNRLPHLDIPFFGMFAHKSYNYQA
ncbi:hypothetical protein SAMN05660226_01747 [Parapedobacter luteus]|uniref:Uncharacterized protein n=1 Tax=Parapedobacter luteus TaxID=623280 RepID=A0A1T5BTR1_9SPHI|nr:hypothetical protein SAMN05660226_01747 [Parapedobacter luteus]